MAYAADTHIATAPRAPSSGSDDYSVIRQVIEYLTENWRDQPSLETIAAEIGMEPTRLQKLFTSWAGLSPKAFLQAVTLDHARNLLAQSATVLDTAYEVGLSGPSRLHDLFVTHEAVTPGVFRARGEGLVIRYGFHPSPFGAATTYSDVARRIERPKAARAVGAAVGRNPISFVVPCHRVLGRSGSLTGYHWGLTRKRAILGWEAGISGAA